MAATKRSVVLDPSPSGPGRMIDRLLAWADIVVADAHGVATLRRLDRPMARWDRVCPHLVACAITPFGLAGPLSGWSAGELTLQAESGVMASTGYSDRPPTRAGIPLGAHAGALVAVTAILAALRTREAGGPGQLATSQREIPTIGLQQGPVGELVLRDCRVPKANLLGEPGDAHHSLTFTWLANRAGLGLFGVHLAPRALDTTVAPVRTRVQFGQPLGRFQLVQGMLAEMATLTDASRLLCYRALALLDRGVWCHRESSMAKAYATEAAVKVTNMAIQLHGSSGLAKELPLERWARDARMLTLPDGTTQIQQLIIGRELVGLRAFA